MSSLQLLTSDFMRYSNVSDTIGQLGNALFNYISLQTALSIDWFSLKSDEWHQIVKNQVYKINELIFDEHDAYTLMDKQNNKCRRCSSDFSLDNRPLVTKEVKVHHFLGMDSTEVKFHWICSFCSDANEKLEDKIAHLVKEEEEQDG